MTKQPEPTKAWASVRQIIFCVRVSVFVCLCLCVDTSRHKAAPAFQPLLPLRLQVICTVIPAE